MVKDFKNPKLKVKKGDTVQMLLGKDRGKQGVVIAVLPARETVVVEGINLVKKHVRPRRQGEKGQRVSIAAPVRVSRVQVVCPKCKKASRIGIKREGGIAMRVCKKCNAAIE